MKIKDFENLILHELRLVISRIIDKNRQLKISAKSRSGAEISDYLENEFIKETAKHKYFKKSKPSPKGATKNPWDAHSIFTIKKHEETIWIDFKAVKVSGKDCNPDIGTPTKIVKLIGEGYFYLVYIFVYYRETDDGLEFVKNSEGDYLKAYFLKDISHTFRRNPKNQLQVNVSAKPEVRTREEFINLLYDKIEQSHKRQMDISIKALKDLKKKSTQNRLIEINKISEEKIKNL